MIFDPEMLQKMAAEWDPEPFNQALDQAAIQQTIQGTISQGAGPIPGAAGAPQANPGGGMNYAKMLGGAQGMMQQPAAPMVAPPPMAMPGAPNIQSVAGARRPTQAGQVPDLATILGRR